MCPLVSSRSMGPSSRRCWAGQLSIVLDSRRWLAYCDGRRDEVVESMKTRLRRLRARDRDGHGRRAVRYRARQGHGVLPTKADK